MGVLWEGVGLAASMLAVLKKPFQASSAYTDHHEIVPSLLQIWLTLGQGDKSPCTLKRPPAARSLTSRNHCYLTVEITVSHSRNHCYTLWNMHVWHLD